MATSKRTSTAKPKKAIAKKANARKAAPNAASKQPVKKAATKKATTLATKSAPKTEAPAWNTIHVFGYGESQVIGSKANGKAPNGQLKSLAPLFAALAKKQQKGTKISLDDTHALNIFNEAFVEFHPNGAKNIGQRFTWADVNTKTVNKLADELLAKSQKTAAHKPLLERLKEKRKIEAAKNKAAAKTQKKTTKSIK